MFLQKQCQPEHTPISSQAILQTHSTSLTSFLQEHVLDYCWSFSLAWGGNKNVPVPLHLRPDMGQRSDRTEFQLAEAFREAIFRPVLQMT